MGWEWARRWESVPVSMIVPLSRISSTRTGHAHRASLRTHPRDLHERRSPRAYGVAGMLTSPSRPPSPMSSLETRMREGRNGRRGRSRELGTLTGVARRRGSPRSRRRQCGGDVRRGTSAGERSGRARWRRAGCRVAPSAGDVAGDVDADFHHRLGFHQRDVQSLPAAHPAENDPVHGSHRRLAHPLVQRSYSGPAVFRGVFPARRSSIPEGALGALA